MSPAAPPIAHVTPPFAELSRLTPPAQVRALTPMAAPAGWTTYDVRRGDTLFELALRHRGSVDALAARNGMPASTVLREGQRILVPRRVATVPARSTTTRARLEADAGSRHTGYVVRPGDTLNGIAERLGVRADVLAAANDVADPDAIRPGRRLLVPGGREAFKARTAAARAAAARAGTSTVTVRAGDGLATIADRYGVSRASLLKANDLAPGEMLHPGQRLRVVGARAGVPTGPGTARAENPELAAHVAANRAYLANAVLPDRARVRDLVVQTARRHDIDPALALAVAWQESRWTQRAVSDANAIGVMQCLPATGRWVGRHLGRDLDLLTTRDNITCGVGLLRALARSTTSDREAVAAYYQGLASVRSHGLYPDTQAYVESVLAHRARM